MDKKVINRLIKKAIDASKNSYSPYSNYKVGSAILAKNGEIFTGTNIENASYGTTVCAERIAIFNAVSNGNKDLKAIAIYTKDGGFPCGACLQVLAEFSPNIDVIIAKGLDDYKLYKFSDFLPNPFILN
jgi:cytidine deaminase